MTQYLEKNATHEMIEVLHHVLADPFILYFKTHAYHWNVEGVHFDQLHKLFGDQYTEMWEAMDDIAERIRALGAYAPMNVTDLMKSSDLTSADGQISAIDMVKDLAKDHETISKHISVATEKASEVGDEVTADMLIGRQTIHDKTAWMLNSTAK